MLDPAFLDQIRARTTISNLIQRSVKLTRSGNEWKACCPFHNEKSPSFWVNDDKAFYHCFGCGAHGDAIKWLTEQVGLTFMDAVKQLADAAGMEMPARDDRAQQRADERAPLFEAMAAAQAAFAANREARVVGSYMDRRSISRDLAATFGLGFAPDNKQWLPTALPGIAPQVLIDAGLRISVDDREPYDRFRNRLTFPIHDVRGRVIGFGGRILGDGDPKYLNSPETPLFDKGRTLFNHHRAAPAARKAGRLIVVEGYMDVIGLARAGLAEVVAPNGTAVTEAQLVLMWRLASEPIFCMDGDKAGQKAMVRAALRALPGLTPDRSLRFVSLPAGQDPDDITRAGGRDAFEQLLGQSLGVAELLWRHESAQGRLDEPEGRAGLKQRLTEHVQTIADDNVRSQFADEFRNRFDKAFTRQAPPAQRSSSPRGQRGQWKKQAMRDAPATPEARDAARNIGSQIGNALVVGLVNHPAVIWSHIETISRLPLHGPSKQLLDTLIDIAIASPPDPAYAARRLDDFGMGPLVDQLRSTVRLPFSFMSPSAARGAQDLIDAINAQVQR